MATNGGKLKRFLLRDILMPTAVGSHNAYCEGTLKYRCNIASVGELLTFEKYIPGHGGHTMSQHDIDYADESLLRLFRGTFVSCSDKAFGVAWCKEPYTVHICCPVCENRCLHSIPETREHFEESEDPKHIQASPFKECGLDSLARALECTIKRDETAKLSVFLIMLNAQTEDDQAAVAFSAESAAGKSYISMECGHYFPEREVMEIAGASPTAWVHENGIKVIERDDTYVSVSSLIEPLEVEREEIEEQIASNKKDAPKELKQRLKEIKARIAGILSNSKIMVDMENKIVIFIDQPDTKFLGKIRPFLSHDKKNVEFTITDKSQHGGNKTKHVILRGYASIFFCTASSRYDDQESTRILVLSPETNPDKVQEALLLLTEKLSDRDAFYDWLDSNPSRRNLIFRVELIRLRNIKRCIVPEEIRLAILENFKDLHKSLMPRHQRDYVRLFSLIYGHALLNCFNRKLKNGQTIIATLDDIEAAFSLYEPVKAANEAGINPNDYEIFRSVILKAYLAKSDDPEWPGLTCAEISSEYFKVYKRPISMRRLVDYTVKALVECGLLTEAKHPKDGRKSVFIPTLTNVDTDEFRFKRPSEGGPASENQSNSQRAEEGKSSGVPHTLGDIFSEQSSPEQAQTISPSTGGTTESTGESQEDEPEDLLPASADFACDNCKMNFGQDGPKWAERIKTEHGVEI